MVNETTTVRSDDTDRNSPFRFSETRNKFTVIGCNTLGLIGNNNSGSEYQSGCFTYCATTTLSAQTDDNSCSGMGCSHAQGWAAARHPYQRGWTSMLLPWESSKATTQAKPGRGLANSAATPCSWRQRHLASAPSTSPRENSVRWLRCGHLQFLTGLLETRHVRWPSGICRGVTRASAQIAGVLIPPVGLHGTCATAHKAMRAIHIFQMDAKVPIVELMS